MKLFSFSVILLLLLSANSIAQVNNNSKNSPKEKDLYGSWHLVYASENSKPDTLIFTKTGSYEFGERIEINKNGDFVDVYTAQCGNDSNRHNTTGKWTYNSKTQIFKTTIPIFFKDNTYKVNSLTNDTLKLISPK
jgi:hypothetical protein